MAWTATEAASDAIVGARLIAAGPRLEGPPKPPRDAYFVSRLEVF
jgi:hypothetical protein